MKRTYTILALLAGLWLQLDAQGIVFQDKKGNQFRYAPEQIDSVVLTDKATYDRMLTTPAEAVDLGLSVKWASWNVGATAPAMRGGYFSWGETSEKINYNWGAYRLLAPEDDSYDTFQDIGSDITGTQYDVARQLWGGDWRMPTATEFRELKDRCTFEWTTVDGTPGAIVTGPNGNSIFMPQCEYRGNNHVQENGPSPEPAEELNSMQYWTSTFIEGSYRNYFAHLFFAINPALDYGTNPDKLIEANNRYLGLQVRAVCSKEPQFTFDVLPAADITPDGATLSASFSCPDLARVSSAGFRLHDWYDQELASFATENVEDGNFMLTATGLEENTEYYFEPYIVYDGVTYYGAMRSFTTTETPETFNAVATGYFTIPYRVLLGGKVFNAGYEAALYQSDKNNNKYNIAPFLDNNDGIYFTVDENGRIVLDGIFHSTGYETSSLGKIYAAEATDIYSDPALDGEHSHYDAENDCYFFTLGYHNNSNIFGIVEDLFQVRERISPNAQTATKTFTPKRRQTGRPLPGPMPGMPGPAYSPAAPDKPALAPAVVTAGRDNTTLTPLGGALRHPATLPTPQGK